MDATLYARIDTDSKEGMNEGWVIGDGTYYVKEEGDAIDFAIDAGYASLDEAFEDDYIYYTEWEDEEDYQYIEINGKMYEIEVIGSV
tara:strand:+ start:544 stop:804 length:261 start_codon:yes stop_codon:yes gene_type:complete